VEWLDRLANRFLAHVWQNYYPRGRWGCEWALERKASWRAS
jgi:hypothetical protein